LLSTGEKILKYFTFEINFAAVIIYKVDIKSELTVYKMSLNNMYP
jgi:hypothetical protein